MRAHRICSVVLFLGVGSLMTGASALAQSSVNPQEFGVVQAPTAGSNQIPLGQLPPHIRHAAQVAFKRFDDGAVIVSAQIDKDDVMGVYEVRGRATGGVDLEADIRPDGTVEELEVEIGEDEVPPAVLQALQKFATGFAPAASGVLIEKSIRPSAIGLPEIWYEFSGTTFDVEVRSDGMAVLIEPA